MDYLLHLAYLCGVYVVLALSLDLVAGHLGRLSIAHAGFYAIGAYTSALLSVHFDTPFLLGLVAGMALAAVASLIVSLPSIRLRGDYFVIATFGLQVILFSIFNNWMSVTRGPLGIPGIPRPTVFGWTIDSPTEYTVLILLTVASTFLVVSRVVQSHFGRVIRAIREDEDFAASFGINTTRFKVTSFALSAALAALAGTLYAHYVTFIDPMSFTFMESILIVSMVIIGGPASKWGPVIGAVALILLPEALRFLGIPGSVSANVRQIVYGGAIVAMMMVRPRGILGRYDFDR